MIVKKSTLNTFLSSHINDSHRLYDFSSLLLYSICYSFVIVSNSVGKVGEKPYVILHDFMEI